VILPPLVFPDVTQPVCLLGLPALFFYQLPAIALVEVIFLQTNVLKSLFYIDIYGSLAQGGQGN
jgi:hypothetical protein